MLCFTVEDGERQVFGLVGGWRWKEVRQGWRRRVRVRGPLGHARPGDDILRRGRKAVLQHGLVVNHIEVCFFSIFNR